MRLLGDGEFSAKIDIEVAGASASARAAVEKAGGTLTTTFKKKVYMNKKGEAGQAPAAPPEIGREAGSPRTAGDTGATA